MAPRDATTRPPHHTEEPGADHRAPRSPLSTLLRFVAGVVIAASFAVWIYAYSGLADRPPHDLLVDTDLAARAESICFAALTDVEAMPSASEATDGADRATQVHRSTDRFEAMVADLENLRVDEAEDRVIMGGWLADWRTLIEDRRRYARSVADDPNTTFLLTNVADGERLDRRLTRVADINRMPSCATPTDVG